MNLNSPGLLRGLVIGMVLAAGGIGLFLLLYLGPLAGMEAAPRLLLALCVPPLLMAAGLLAYLIFSGRFSPPS
ncbi:MAG: hypothetical protein MUE40_05190 [Anaerolineae bacterium]|jgi:hypothetical protein|nr:hypothetical protein [Anaerolineae bacterium]